MLQENWNREFTVGDYVKVTLVGAAIYLVGYGVGYGVVYGVMYVVDKVKHNKQLKHIEKNPIEEK